MSDIESIPHEALKAVGIDKLKYLRMNARTPNALAELARKIGASQDDVNGWVAQAFEYKKIEDAADAAQTVAAAAGASITTAAPDASAAQPASAPAASSPTSPALAAPTTPTPVPPDRVQPSQTSAGVAPDQMIEPAAAVHTATATTAPDMGASTAAPIAPAQPAPSPASPPRTLQLLPRQT